MPEYRKAPLELHILIVGCGLGGLAAAHCLAQAGHRITLFESAPAIGEVGAGIQVSPNITRLLIRWGLGEELKRVSVKPEALVFRRYSNGEMVAYTRWAERMDAFGAPYYHIHRADFHKLLYDLAKDEMELRLNSTVVDCDPEAPSITLASGEVVHGDLIIGADGIKSRIQKAVLGRENPAHPTGDAAYRATIPAANLLADPELQSLVKTPEMTGWMGPQRHIMGYLVVSNAFTQSHLACGAYARAPSVLASFTISSCCTQTMAPSSRGPRRVARIRCALTSPTSSLGMRFFTDQSCRSDLYV